MSRPLKRALASPVQIRSISKFAALGAVALLGLLACKPKQTYVLLTISAGANEPTGIRSLEVQLALGGKTATTVLTEPGGGDLSLPTDVTFEIGSGSGQLAVTAIARSADGKELDRGTVTAQVNTGALTTASLVLAGGKSALTPEVATQDFGSVALGSRSLAVALKLRNATAAATGTLTAALGGVGANAFLIDSDHCSGAPLAPGASCTVGVVFAPSAAGSLAGTLTVGGSPGGSVQVALTGIGTGSEVTLTVANAGTGVGVVTSSDGAINCGGAGAACSSQYPTGTAVSLTAAPTAGSDFASWSEPGCTGATCIVTLSSARTVTATFTRKIFRVSINRVGDGNVTSSPAGIDCGAVSCSASFPSGTPLTLTAVAGNGLHVASWSASKCTAGSVTCVFTPVADIEVTVTFTQVAGDPLSVALKGTGSGTVTSSPMGIDCPAATCSTPFPSGQQVTLTESPAEGSTFSGWNVCTGLGSTCTVTVTGSTSVEASFTLQPEKLTVGFPGAGSGSVTVTPSTGSPNPCPSSAGNCVTMVDYGTQVTLTASKPGFGGWNNCPGAAGTTCTRSFTSDTTVQAIFLTASVPVKVVLGGSGSGKVVSAPSGIDCGTTCTASFSPGQQLTLTASANPGSEIGTWSAPGCAQGSATCTVTPFAALTVNVTFNLIPETLSLAFPGGGSGTVVVTPQGGSGTSCLSGPSGCSDTYPYGTSVSVTAAPASGSTFAGWGNACTGSGACTVSLTQALTVSATFNVVQVPVSVTTSGKGSGVVSSAPTGLSCGAICTANFPYGQLVTLTAAPATGSSLGAWSASGCASGSSTCALTPTTAQSVDVAFGLLPEKLTAAASGPGAVTSGDSVILCGTAGTACSATYDYGSMVTLTAAASNGAVFLGWSGGGCATAASCQVTMNKAQTVTANFAPLVAVTISKGGDGTGTVTSAPAGLSCGATCTANFPAGQALTLTAAPASGALVGAWSVGSCAIGSPTCSVTPAAATTVTVTFILNSEQLGVSVTGMGGVTSSPAGIACGAAGNLCSASYSNGTSVLLTAAPNSGWAFAGWSGACSGAGTCAVPMTKTQSVTATFTALGTVTLTKSGDGTGSVTSSPAGLDCGSTCAAPFVVGTPITLTAVPDASSQVGAWSVSGCAIGSATCTFTPESAPVVTVTFVLKNEQLSLSYQGTGAGRVTSSPAGIDCTANCAASFPNGQSVTLTALATAGSAFTGWSGSGCSGTSTCVVSMTSALIVKPAFAPLVNVTVGTSGDGSGSVTSTPAGVSCGTTCTASFPSGQQLTLTASPAAGSQIAAWSSASCARGSTTCVVTPSADTTVSVAFVLSTEQLMLTFAGGGAGSVLSSPAGINCTASCAAGFTNGQPVMLTATAANGSVFSGWTFAGCGLSTTCAVPMTQAQNVTATFTPLVTVTVGLSGDGSGTVSSTPAGLSCGTTCSASFPSGQSLTLTATPASGSRVGAWSIPACSSSGSTTCAFTPSANTTVTVAFVLSVEQLKVAVTGGGSVTATPPGNACTASCSSNYTNGTSVSLSASPNTGFTFSGWGGDCTGTGACTLTMDVARSVTALFTAIPESLQVAVAGAGAGSVTSNPAGISCTSGVCTASFNYGQSVTLTEAPVAGSGFAGWSGAVCSDTSTTCTVPMTQAQSVTATFTPLVTVTVGKTGDGSGSVSSTPAGVSCGATCSALFFSGQQLTLTATPVTGSQVGAWSVAGCSAGSSTCAFTPSANTTVGVSFVLTTEQLNLTFAGSGAGTVLSSPSGINCTASCSAGFANGQSVTLTAAAAGGSVFSGWSDPTCTGATCAVSMTQMQNLTATFTPLVTVSVNGTGGDGTGSVSSAPAGISCGATCSASFPSGQSLTLTATPASGSQIGAWSPAGCSTGSATCTFTPSANTNVIVAFVLSLEPLQITVTGGGSVIATPPSSACSGNCSLSYANGAAVSLAASPNTGFTFTGWGGDCTGTGACSVKMGVARTVTALFTAIPESLKVTVAGAGSGSVTSAPAGISCASGAVCTASFNYGQSVVLTAAATTGSGFTGFSGGGCGVTTPCTVSMNQAQNVTATFVPLVPVTVNKSGDGSGAVSSVPAGLSCGGTCTASFPSGQPVTLTASPVSGSQIGTWSVAGCASGSSTCQVTPGSATTVTVNFILSTEQLSVAVSGTGSVSSSPTGISCGSTCSAGFANSQSVTLTAAAGTNAGFTNWAGACSGSSSTCTVPMTSVTSVSAVFTVPLSVTVAGSGAGTVTSSPAGISCTSGTCTSAFAPGTSVTLTATPSASAVFSGWSGASCSGGGTCIVTMSAPQSATATFTPLVTVSSTRSGDGTGTVTSSPGGISCGGTCSASFASGATITLTASPASGSQIGAWSASSGCGIGASTCQVTASAGLTVDVAFLLSNEWISVSITGDGLGSVVSTPSGISCNTGSSSSPCSAVFSRGSTVTLRFAHGANSAFNSWTGCPNSSGTTCTVPTIAAATSVSADCSTICPSVCTNCGAGVCACSGTLCP